MADEEKEDRISSLPDFILLEIISRIKIIEVKYNYEEEERLMTTKEVIRTTSTISKRWQHLWTQCPNLTFLRNYDIKTEDSDDDHTDYHSFIDKALTQCPIDVKLNKFEVDITFNSCIDTNTLWFPPINRWIHYAITRNVQEVQLWLCDFNVHDPELVRYDDELFFNNSCITSIKISYCEFNPPNGAIRWDKLKYLSIQNGILDEDMIQTILSGSPVLETLVLHNCYVERIDVTSTSVKNLKFSIDYGPVPIKINAPYILSLTINDCCNLEKLLLLNVSSLVKVHLYGYNHGCSFIKSREDIVEEEHGCSFIKSREDIVEEEFLKGLLQSLGHVNDIALWNYFLEVFSRLEAKGFQFRKGSDLISRDSASYRLFSLVHK